MTAPPQSTVSDVKEFVRLDDGIKEATAQLKDAKKGREAARERIVKYMCSANVKRLGIKKGTQYLEAREKTTKIRACADVIKAKLKELVSKGVTDSDIIYKEIMSCGGTRKVWKLCRRSVRKQKQATPPEEDPEDS
jgi:hypothetical protein